MKPAALFALLTLLCLAAAPASADTFELSDPANEMHEEWQERSEEAPAAPKPDMICEVDLDSGACSCVDAETRATVEVSRGKCLETVSDAAAARLQQ